MNFLRTGLLMLTLSVLFVLVGYLIGGPTGVLIALALSIAMHLWGYWASDTMVLRMHGAIEADERTAPEYVGIVRNLAARAGLPMPRVCILQNPQPNAFATGRNPEHAAVCATTGLLDMLTKEEVTGVLAHELSHVKNRDTLTMAIAATLAGAISLLANFAFFFGGSRDRRSPLGPLGVLLVAIAAPFAAMLVQMAISRSREYDADALGAQISGHPLWLASALSKLEASRRRILNQTAEEHPATAHLFIVNPLSGRGLDNLFITHPSTSDRIARREAIARQMGQLAPGATSFPSFDGPSVAADDAAATGGGFGGRPGAGRGPWG
jgi:heat shock protein HtpX